MTVFKRGDLHIWELCAPEVCIKAAAGLFFSPILWQRSSYILYIIIYLLVIVTTFLSHNEENWNEILLDQWLNFGGVTLSLLPWPFLDRHCHNLLTHINKCYVCFVGSGYGILGYLKAACSPYCLHVKHAITKCNMNNACFTAGYNFVISDHEFTIT